MTLNRAFLSALMASALFSTNALASDNTITFMGEVSDETCSISVNGSDASPVVLLPTVTATELNANQVAGATTFDVGVSNCTGSSSGVQISTVFVGNNISSATGNATINPSNNSTRIQVLPFKLLLNDLPENVFDFIACHLRFADKYLLQCQWNHFAEYWILCLYFLKYFFSGPSCSKYQK